MRNRAICAALMTAAALFAVPQKSFGLAALATGAKTSCKPTAPAGTPLNRTQVNCDPLGVTDYQLTVTYDPTLVMFVQDDDGIVDLNGYFNDVQVNYFDDTETPDGTLTLTGGYDGDGPLPLVELDVVGLVFELISTAPGARDVPLHFSVEARDGDYIDAIDPDHPDTTITYSGSGDGPTQIKSSESNLTLNQIDAQSVPVPLAVYGGFTLCGVMAISQIGRRVQRARI